MKFSLFYELQMAKPTPDEEARLIAQCARQAVMADELGYHCLWAVEHHGLYGYSHSSAPEVFLSYVAGKTRKIRLGHGISLTPHRYNHPIRVAERVAMLDVLSGGRVNWGSGRSSSNIEPELFGASRDTLESEWREALELVPAIWQNDVFEWNGQHYKVPPTRIRPHPVQKPHPPMFAPAFSDHSLLSVAELGLGALNFSLGSFDEMVAKIGRYRAALANSPARPYARNDCFAVTVNTCVLPNDHEACRHGFRGARYFKDAFNLYYYRTPLPLSAPMSVNTDDLDDQTLAFTKKMRMNPETQLLSMIGDPAIAREKVRLFQEAGVDELLLCMQLGTVPPEIVERSLICFAEQVMSHFL
ncbi:LLM class flavin-dependent oxidoreductase [Trinickia caryophylli]|uniref:Flavin-dependent oxidoreductase, luciferase family (Includes alkanesulfonate monooxygenase SsuD and methylene tetrahydromethanopterin reductase) n=1 Tax=Trinickia caryophylli TaxID=28094 RepID=A0A1X7G6X6_TRICW|nr:LLM class flavin-dependent oxidoreductase [Trinickia caryophylli]PMS13814.1 flavin-dependent oxidoreductase [Trinickia caryophylli]TRX14310.1 LLM class flavin-dependent oxidoreductase [Trinickia caryophylli]WQE14139.1 LLM class flavin-dependent oxidoreductase [Trinickia caryophylli]SMF64253.1 Flavin-dependent oxidoreductase, luciferase family (includes alkanesulfonate monooxygenase SsuD and methylene tetrahydromethanopterin reductase) [Trinickia caryophylli]GLU33362.1 flavin-dependent oxido